MKVNIFILLFCAFALFQNSLTAQTPGMILEPATGSDKAILDRDNNGFTSVSGNGFVNNDQLESELPFIPMVFPGLEPTEYSGPKCTTVLIESVPLFRGKVYHLIVVLFKEFWI